MVLGVVLARTQEHREKLLKDSNTTTRAHQQRTITIFFRPISPNATSQSRATQVDSQPGHCQGVTIDWAIAICRAHGPQSYDLTTLSLIHKGHYGPPS